MEEAHPVIIVVLMALIPVISGVIVYFLALSRLPIIVSLPLAIIIGMAIYTYLHAMQSYFKQGKIRRFAALAVILALIIITPYVTYVVATPNWSFTVTTNKTVYQLGEDVTITVSLKNLGYITHSFKSLLSDPIFVTVFLPGEWPDYYYYWYSHYSRSISEFSVGPNGLLEREFVWNQIAYVPLPHGKWNESAVASGTYYVEAFIPNSDAFELDYEPDCFASAHTHIEIASP